jgi:hypothetical protein
MGWVSYLFSIFNFINKFFLKGVIDHDKQYTKRTKKYMEECQMNDPTVQFLSDGLTVSNIVIFSIFTTFFFTAKTMSSVSGCLSIP